MGREGTGVAAASETSIQITFQYRGERCREKIALKPTPANLKRATQFRAAVLHSISIGTFDYATTFPSSKRAKKFAVVPGQAETVEKTLSDWLAKQKKQLKASTYDGYRKVVENLVIPEFGAKMLADWSRKDVKDWLSERQCSNKRLSNIQSVIRAALTEAVEDRILEQNFMLDWCYQNKAQVKEDDDVDPFSKEEQALILDACDPAMRVQAQFFLWTGLRTSELVALNESDIDYARMVVSVRKATTTAAKGEIEDTKTKSGKREVKLLGPALTALQSRKLASIAPNAPLFLNPYTGERWTGDQQIRDAWVRILKKAGVRYRRPYQTRHTYASMMLSAGEHPMWVAQQMGHSNWAMISKIYGKWIPSANPDAGSKAEALFAAPKQHVINTGSSCH